MIDTLESHTERDDCNVRVSWALWVLSPVLVQCCICNSVGSGEVVKVLESWSPEEELVAASSSGWPKFLAFIPRVGERVGLSPCLFPLFFLPFLVLLGRVFWKII